VIPEVLRKYMGDIEKILHQAFTNGFNNFLTLEPHLSLAEADYGRTSLELFQTAVTALNGILEKIGIRA
jgi:hypothetical protein